MRGSEQAAGMRRLLEDYDNLRAALAWAADTGEAETLGRLTVALLTFWYRRGLFSEGRQWLERELAIDGLSVALRVRALGGVGILAAEQIYASLKAGS